MSADPVKGGGGHPRDVHKVGNCALDMGISGTIHWAEIAQIITIQAPRKLGTGYGILGTEQGGCVQIITTQAAHDSPPTLHTLFSFTPQVKRTLYFDILLQIRIALPPRFCMYCPGHRENRLFTHKAKIVMENKLLGLLATMDSKSSMYRLICHFHWKE